MPSEPLSTWFPFAKDEREVRRPLDTQRGDAWLKTKTDRQHC